MGVDLNYIIALQRAIEFHCRGEIIPKKIMDLCPHHANMLNKCKECNQVKEIDK